MSSIYLIRHGQASFGTDNYDRLSDLGRRQASVLGGFLSSTGIEFDAVISGDLERQRDTAELATGRKPERIDPRFNEVDNEAQFKAIVPLLTDQNPEIPALMEKAFHDSRSYQLVLRKVFQFWVTTDLELPGVESWASYSANAWAGLSELMADYGRGKSLGLFTSGGTIATLAHQVLGLPGTGCYQLFEPMINCSVTRLVYNGDDVALQYYNDHSCLAALGEKSGENLVSYR
ncbi:MAG: broad specificity phosphatase PhoE [Halieaceae bacterium]